MPQVIRPGGKQFIAEDGEALLDVALHADVALQRGGAPVALHAATGLSAAKRQAVMYRSGRTAADRYGNPPDASLEDCFVSAPSRAGALCDASLPERHSHSDALVCFAPA